MLKFILYTNLLPMLNLISRGATVAICLVSDLATGDFGGFESLTTNASVYRREGQQSWLHGWCYFDRTLLHPMGLHALDSIDLTVFVYSPAARRMTAFAELW